MGKRDGISIGIGSIPKQLRDAYVKARQQGWVITKTKSHLSWYPPEGGFVLTNRTFTHDGFKVTCTLRQLKNHGLNL